MRRVALILAGGQSRRMGQNKLLLSRDVGRGATCVLEHVVQTAAMHCDVVHILTSPHVDIGNLAPINKLRVHPDRDFYCGPLPSLAHAWPQRDESDVVYVIAGDLPGLTGQVLTSCVTALLERKDVDAVLPVREQKLQPLLGCYRQRAGTSWKKAVSQGESRIMKAVENLNLYTLDVEELNWPVWWTRPIHTPQDYVEWLRYQEGNK